MLEFDAALSTVVEIKEKSQRTVNSPAGAKPNGPLSAELLDKMHRYWFAANYLCVGQIYLLDNPLLREPLSRENIKPRLLGHWGTSAGQNFIYVHLNRLIRQMDANIIYISGPGHGGPTDVYKRQVVGCAGSLRRRRLSIHHSHRVVDADRPVRLNRICG